MSRGMIGVIILWLILITIGLLMYFVNPIVVLIIPIGLAIALLSFFAYMLAEEGLP